jgi:Flp pilus assembly protein TadD
MLAGLMAVGIAFGLYLGLGGSETASSLLQKGQDSLKAGDYQKAVEDLESAVKKEPRSSEAYDLLGAAYGYLGGQTGNTAYRAKAVESFRKAIELDPGSYSALFNLGASLYYQGDKKGAAVYLQKALDVNPNSAEKAQIEQMIQEGQ